MSLPLHDLGLLFSLDRFRFYRIAGERKKKEILSVRHEDEIQRAEPTTSQSDRIIPTLLLAKT